MLIFVLYITDRTVSKWENGVCLSDVGTMPELCKILCITINDLFSGEDIDMKDNEKKLEANLLEMARIKEERDKELLFLEIFIGITVSILMFTCIFIASFVNMSNLLRILIIIIGIIPFMIGTGYAIRIEQIAWYYECNKCHHKYIPTFSSGLWAMHINRTRYMKCPKCGKRSWNKKVIRK